MKLPNGDRAVVEERKLREYVLNLNHPIGCHHAVLFRDLLGIAEADWASFRDILLQSARKEDVTPGQASAHGRKWEMRIIITGPHGPKTVLAVWLEAATDPDPRLITCYVE